MQKAIRVIVIFTLVLLIFYGYFQIKNQRAIYVSEPVKEAELSPTMTVMTYNIHHGIGPDGDYKLEEIAEIVEAEGVDIVAFNEVDRKMSRSNFSDQPNILADRLQMNFAFGPTFSGIIGSYGNAILSRYPILGVENIILPGKLWSEPRALLQVELYLPDQSKLLVMTTHLSPETEEREEQLAWIKDYLATLEEPFLLMGDFNVELAELPPYLLASQGVKSYPSLLPQREIDKVISSADFLILDSYSLINEISDHLPVVVELAPATLE